MNVPKVTIIIPLYVTVPRFFKDLMMFQSLEYDNYEILVVSDKKVDLPKVKGIHLILTGKRSTGPAEKRDIAIEKAKGKYCAFIDDDAYPHRKWLKYAVQILESGNYAAVGGPGVTPKEDPYWAQITGLVYSSFFCGGYAQHRFVPLKKREVQDYPAYNLIVKTKVLKDVGGYGSHFYGGEDTFLCLKIIEAGHHILYDPRVVVYHHRRPLFVPYLKQISNVGKHRGYFAKKFPKTSRKFSYFVPSILSIVFLLLGIGSLVWWEIGVLFGVGLLLSLSAAAVSIKNASLVDATLAAIAIILTHLSYGFSFLIGLWTKDLKR